MRQPLYSLAQELKDVFAQSSNTKVDVSRKVISGTRKIQSMISISHQGELHQTQMDDIIEITDDEERSRNTEVINKSDGPEILTLLTEEEVSEDVLSCPQTAYPSSPQNMNIEEEGNLQFSRESIEISAPFFQELSSSREDDLSSRNKSVACEPTLKQKGKHLLDDILDDYSSPYSHRISVEQSDTGPDLKKVVTKWSISCKRIESPIGTSASLSTPPNRPKYNSIPNNISTGDAHISAREIPPPIACQNVFTEYPLSSPIANKKSHDKNLEHNQFSSKGELCIEKEQEDPICTSKLPEDGQSGRDKNAFGANRLKYRELLENDEETRRLNNPQTIELNLIKFLADGEEANGPSTPLKQHTVNDVLQRSDVHHGAEGLNIEIAPSFDVVKLSEIEKLRKYIIQGNVYTKEESEKLTRHWLTKDREAFRQANQIYRSNEKARSAIIVEMPAHMIETFKRDLINIEQLIAPATLQAGYEKELPKIRFLRRCNSIYDFNHDTYYPSELKTMEENINILYYDAQDFFEQYKTSKRALFQTIQSFSKANKYLIVVLSNLDKFKRSLEMLEDQKFKAKVKERLDGSQSDMTSGNNKRLKPIRTLNMKKFDIEQRLRHIDRLWGVKIHTVPSNIDFINSLPNLISIIGKQRMDPAIRFMRYSHINVKSGKDKTDVLRQTLQQINRMPELKANGVINAYHTFQSLFHDFKKGELQSAPNGKHLMTEAMEERLYKLFTCRNPNESIQS